MACQSVLPLKFSDAPTNVSAMSDADPLIHPDSNDYTRYCLGNRIQMWSNAKGSHKAKECLYHDLDLCNDGKFLKEIAQNQLSLIY